MKKENPPFIVLMADDDEDDCLLVGSAFQEIGIAHDLHFVDDGRELLDYLLHEGDFADPEKYPRPNLILLDLNMPRIDGREALSKIKSDPQLKDIPVLILTTSGRNGTSNLANMQGRLPFYPSPKYSRT